MNLKQTLALLLVAMSAPAVAQHINVTPKIGVNHTTVSNSGFVEFTVPVAGSDVPKTVVSPYGKRELPASSPTQSLTREPYAISRVQIGFGIEKVFSNTFSLESGLSYTQKGFRTYTPTDPGFTFFKDGATSTQKADYLELPLLARFNFGSNRVRWFANAGPYAAYWLRYDFSSEATSPAVEKQVDLTNADFNRLDLGLAAGAGVRVKAGAGEFLTELRYSFGLRDQQNNIEMPKGNAAVQNRVASVLVGYAFPLGKRTYVR
jgi:hypothetical protein